MVPIFEAGRFYLPTTLWRVNLEGRRVDLVTTFIEEEYKPFPVAVHDDMFDALSRVLDQELGTFWPQPAEVKIRDRYAQPRYRRQRSLSQWAMYASGFRLM
jgi:hypothetical protein